jgi:hypothetical protein
LHVRLPEQAQLLIDGRLRDATGAYRVFQYEFGPGETGKEFTVAARIVRNGKPAILSSVRKVVLYPETKPAKVITFSDSELREPRKPEKPTLAPESDDGKSTTDRQTSQKRPVFFGTADPRVRIQLFYEGQSTALAEVQADDFGNWRIQPGRNLENRVHKFCVRALDPVGNASEFSDALRVKIFKSK